MLEYKRQFHVPAFLTSLALTLLALDVSADNSVLAPAHVGLDFGVTGSFLALDAALPMGTPICRGGTNCWASSNCKPDVTRLRFVSLPFSSSSPTLQKKQNGVHAA